MMKTTTRGWVGAFVGLGLLTALSTSASAQQPIPITRCWKKSSTGGSESWTAKVLSLGSQGSEVFTCTGPLIDYTRIYSAFDSSPPQEMMHIASPEETQRHRVDSASDSDVHVSIYDVRATGPFSNVRDVVVNKYSASSRDWTYNFPVQTTGHQNTFVEVSNDGKTILAAAQNVFNNFSFDIAFLSENYSSGVATATPVSYTPSGLFKDFGLSADGSTFFIAGTSNILVGRTSTRAITHTIPIPFGDSFRSKIAISGSGRFISYGTDHHVRILERAIGTYDLKTSYDIPDSYSFESYVDISDNDAVLAVGINYPPDTHQVRVAAFDLRAAAGPSLLYTNLLTGGGEYNDKISDVSISATGNRFAVGTWGDDQELIPEVLIYSSTQDQPIGKVDLPGSVWDLEVSSDGKSFAVGYKHIHANVFASSETSYSLYDIGKRDFKMSGSPRLGNTLDFSLKARTGYVGKLVVSTANPNYTPADFNGWGISYVDPGSWSVYNLGVGSADNVASRSFSTSQFSQLAGQTLHMQGVVLNRRAFSRDWIKVTLVP